MAAILSQCVNDNIPVVNNPRLMLSVYMDASVIKNSV